MQGSIMFVMKLFWGIIAIVVLSGGALFVLKQNVQNTDGTGAVVSTPQPQTQNEVADVGTPGKYDALAKCLKDKGAVFYGASWCPHCIEQKAEFGSSAHLLPYVECSTPDGKSQMQICADHKIMGYPAWRFADGSEVTGAQSLDTLAQKTGCTLPK